MIRPLVFISNSDIATDKYISRVYLKKIFNNLKASYLYFLTWLYIIYMRKWRSVSSMNGNVLALNFIHTVKWTDLENFSFHLPLETLHEIGVFWRGILLGIGGCYVSITSIRSPLAPLNFMYEFGNICSLIRNFDGKTLAFFPDFSPLLF